jgi:hypothetical protein
MSLQTEFPFKLPKGFVDYEGNVHREGMMRLATAGDEIQPLRDPRVKQNPAYLVIILLSEVITKLGTLNTVSTAVVENMFSTDLAYLQAFYRKINSEGGEPFKVVCPNCSTEVEVDITELGG